MASSRGRRARRRTAVRSAPVAFAPSLLDLTLTLGVLLGAPTVSLWEAPPDPGPSSACPDDMRLVSGRHFEDVEHLCVDWHKGPARCWAYHPAFTVAQGDAAPMRFCMDRFEAPNEEGKKPLVMKSFRDAVAWCAAKDKRLCTEFEWETACESGDERPWLYGWKLDGTICNTTKPWLPFDAAALMSGGDTAEREVARLWQGTPSGAMARCRTRDGIYDLMGNVEEWVASSRKRKFPGALLGGFWAKPWVGCRGTNDAHEPSFVFYEVGFRCCAAPKTTAE